MQQPWVINTPLNGISDTRTVKFWMVMQFRGGNKKWLIMGLGH